MAQVSSKALIVFGLMVAAFTALLLHNINQAREHSELHVMSALGIFLPSITTVLGALAGYLTARHFFYKARFQQLHDRYWRICARYDQFLEQLRSLHNSQVDALLVDVRSVTDSPEFFLFDSKFLAVTEALVAASPKERRQAIAELQTRLKPARRYKEERACPTAGCGGKFQLNLYKGQQFRLRCDQCHNRFLVYISRNDKLVIRRIVTGRKRVTSHNFEAELPDYLAKIHLLVSRESLRLIAKSIVAIYGKSPALSYFQLKKALIADKDLRERLDDIEDAGRVVDALLKSKRFFVDRESGAFPGFSKPTNLEATEERVYMAFVMHVCYKLNEDRQVLVDEGIVRRVMDAVLPSGADVLQDANARIGEVLGYIESADRPDPQGRSEAGHR